jgi:aspartyl protease family protein
MDLIAAETRRPVAVLRRWRGRFIRRQPELVWAFAFLAVTGGAYPAIAQEMTKCVAGQEVTDTEGKTGVIVADDSKRCPVKYADGQIYSWIFWNLHPTAAPIKSGLATPEAGPAGPSPKLPAAANPQVLTVLRPPSNRSLVYRADRLGHFTLTADVNGAPIRAVVDTGASLVALTLQDAQAAGISRNELVFNQVTRTANGPTRFAAITLGEIRIGQIAIDNVPAAVIENLDQSLLGMSFLRRLKSFEMRDGALTINW